MLSLSDINRLTNSRDGYGDGYGSISNSLGLVGTARGQANAE